MRDKFEKPESNLLFIKFLLRSCTCGSLRNDDAIVRQAVMGTTYVIRVSRHEFHDVRKIITEVVIIQNIMAGHFHNPGLHLCWRQILQISSADQVCNETGDVGSRLSHVDLSLRTSILSRLTRDVPEIPCGPSVAVSLVALAVVMLHPGANTVTLVPWLEPSTN